MQDPRMRQHSQNYMRGEIYNSKMPVNVNSFPIFKFKAKVSAGIHNGLEHLDITEGIEYTMRFKNVGCFDNLAAMGAIEPITRVQ